MFGEMTSELQQYAAIGLLLLAVGGLAAAMLLIPSLFGKKRTHHPVKDTPYECGMPPFTEAHARFSVKFYLVAMLFILFDIEVVFFLGWATVYRELLGEMGYRMLLGGALFLVILEVGHIYAWKKGALDWSPRRSSQSVILSEAKNLGPVGKTEALPIRGSGLRQDAQGDKSFQ
jgi:NADH-quinone oxidoreductase subunit A